MDRFGPAGKVTLTLLKIAWVGTVLLAGSAIIGISLPPPLDWLSQGALRLFEILLSGTVFPFFFAGVWIAMCFGLARQTGWNDLAESYGVDRGNLAAKAEKMTTISGKIGDTPFARMYSMGATSEGLVLDTHLLFRLGHKKLLLPWRVVRLTEPPARAEPGLLKRLLAPETEYVTLRIAAHPDFELQIVKSDFDKSPVPRTLHDVAGGVA